MSDIFAPEGGVLDGYGTMRVDLDSCPVDLAEDLRGILAARWLAEVMRSDFETACCGGRVYGTLGNFDGLISNEPLPNYWRKTDEMVTGAALWQPDGRHPVGKWMADMAARLLPMPSPDDVLDGVLRRNGIEGGREPAPQMMEINETSIAVLLYKPKVKLKAPLPQGVRRDDSLLSMWSGHSR